MLDLLISEPRRASFQSVVVLYLHFSTQSSHKSASTVPSALQPQGPTKAAICSQFELASVQERYQKPVRQSRTWECLALKTDQRSRRTRTEQEGDNLSLPARLTHRLATHAARNAVGRRKIPLLCAALTHSLCNNDSSLCETGEEFLCERHEARVGSGTTGPQWQMGDAPRSKKRRRCPVRQAKQREQETERGAVSPRADWTRW